VTGSRSLVYARELDPDPSWRDHAACRKVGPSLFFGVNDSDDERAVAVCRDCPVQEPCLAYALRAREPLGVWGGVPADERQRMAQRRRRAG